MNEKRQIIITGIMQIFILHILIPSISLALAMNSVVHIFWNRSPVSLPEFWNNLKTFFSHFPTLFSWTFIFVALYQVLNIIEHITENKSLSDFRKDPVAFACITVGLGIIAVFLFWMVLTFFTILYSEFPGFTIFVLVTILTLLFFILVTFLQRRTKTQN
jgi:hypothetical protein